MDNELLEAIRAIIREEIRVKAESELLGPEELAERLKVPISWVYEQSRRNAIPTVRIGRYVRFRLVDVLKSQRKEN
jgi:excisionase family DNA binding protein